MTKSKCVANVIVFVLTATLMSEVANASEPDDGKLLPEVTIEGSTSGEGELSVGIGWWKPVGPKPTTWDSALHPLSLTLAIDASMTTEDGVGQVFRAKSQERPPVTVDSQWSLGISLGVVAGYSADRVFRHQEYPGKTLETAYQVSAQMCYESCYHMSADGPVASKDKACEAFVQFVDRSAKADHYDWFEKKVVKDLKQPDELVAAMRRLAPAETPKCKEVVREWENLAEAYVAAIAGNFEGTRLQALATGFATGLKTCAQSCVGKPESDAACATTLTTNRLFRAETKPNFAALHADPDNALCKAGQDIFETLAVRDPRMRRIEAARYQNYHFALGGSIGFAPQEWVEIAEEGGIEVLDDQGMPTGATLDRLSKSEAVRPVASAGMSGAYLDLYGLTFEARAIYARRLEPSDDKVQWCTVEGVVGTTSADPQARLCTTRPFGAPSTGNRVTLDAYLGYADLIRGFWRIAAGPRYMVDVGDSLRHTLGLHIPVSLNLLVAPRNNQKLDYDGVMRITPFVDVTMGAQVEGIPVAFGVSLALLGKRSLFSTRYDQL